MVNPLSKKGGRAERDAWRSVRSKGDVQAVCIRQLAVTYRCHMMCPAATAHTRTAACMGHSTCGIKPHTPGGSWGNSHATTSCKSCKMTHHSSITTRFRLTLLLLLKLMGGRPAAKCCTTLLSSCLPVHSCRGLSSAGGGSCRCTEGVPPGLQGVQAANSSWLNSARVKKQSLQDNDAHEASS
eukprot:GHRQ01008389.1.p1 GENE.GHRQ01008389.1~~GHRQ01008389.1.p1  ORF type:complete len:183 (+),score=30.84 GHRQ01008389.1:657-1205(+)